MANRLTPENAAKDAGNRQPDPAERQAAAEQLSNVTDETRLHHLKKIKGLEAKMITAKERYDSAKGEYRKGLADAEAGGVEYIAKYLKIRKRDLEELDRENKAIAKLAALDGLPIGTQLALIPNGAEGAQTTASFVDENKLARELEDAEEAGWKAGHAGKPNAVPHPKNSRKGIRWQVGYDRGRDGNLGGIKSTNSTQPPEAA